MSFDKILTWFAKVWVFIVFVVTMTSFAGTIITAPSVWKGLMLVRDELDPFNDYRFYTTIIIFLLPAFGAQMWRDRRRKRLGKSN